MTQPFVLARNADAMPVQKIPVLKIEDWREHAINMYRQGGRIVALFGRKQGAGLRLFAGLTGDNDGTLQLCAADLEQQSYPALTPECPQAHLFERELHEQLGVVPEGHPWLKPVRKYRGAPGMADYYALQSDETHEVAVGPVHAGIIEPGHFRFQCHGEEVFHLEIMLGYQHRGIERALLPGPNKKTIHYIETAAGDTTVGHALAYAQAIESLAELSVTPRAHALRAVALELERLANHTGDLGALAGDIGYLPTASYCGRLRGDFLNLTAVICGNRLGRGLVRPGGLGFDLDEPAVVAMIDRLKHLFHEVESAVNLLWDTPSVLGRFESTGTLTARTCLELGMVGPAARACGLKVDVRKRFPLGAYVTGKMPISTWRSGDVFGRAYVRWLEIRHSIRFIIAALEHLPKGMARVDAPKNGLPTKSLAPDSFVLSLTEGWRGEICHVALTDEKGMLVTYKIYDPSFHNWIGLAMALRNQQISDFPVCNKSFNLSYCGHDL